MSQSCCVTGCKNQNTGPDSGVLFYKLPDAKNLKKKWIDAIKSQDDTFEPTDKTLICNVHFVSGQKSPHEWHPDYVPSVFRSLRRERKKVKGRHLDDSDEEAKPFGSQPKVALKRLQSSRVSLSTPTRLTPKNRSFSPSSNFPGSPFLKGPLKKKFSKTPKIVEVKSKYEYASYDTPGKTPIAGRQARNKRKQIGDEFDTDSQHYEEYEEVVVPILKNLRVVLERTSDTQIRQTTTNGEVSIKQEPESENETDYSFSPRHSSPSPPPPTPPRPTMKSIRSPMKSPVCKKCSTLEGKVRRLECEAKRNPNEPCRRCPVMEHKLKKMEVELDSVLESKLNKCQKCTSLEQRLKRSDANIKKAQTEIARLQNRLSTVEISEETFKKYKSKVKLYTGFPNFETLMLIFHHVKDHFPAVGIKSLTPFQMFILVLMRLKLNLPFWDLTYRFGTSPNVIQSFYPQYVVALETQLSHVVLWPKANLRYRLEVLAANLKQSFCIIQEKVDVRILMMPENDKMIENERVIRLCAALYHIAQLVSSNHSQQLMRILKSKEDTDRSTLLVNETNDRTPTFLKKPAGEKENEDADDGKEQPPKLVNGIEGTDDVDDSDIFLEDFSKEAPPPGLNSNDSLEFECKHLQKDIEILTQRLNIQLRFYTGMRNYDAFKNLLGFLEPHVIHISKEKLSYFQQLQLVLIRLKLNLEVQDLAYLFGVAEDHVVYLTKLWIDVMVQKLSRYIDWPAGIEDSDGEMKLLGAVKLKYQILWGPHFAPRNKETGRDKEKIDLRKLLRSCAALYNIDDVEAFKPEKDSTTEKDSKAEDNATPSNDNEALEQQCRSLRTELYYLRKCIMSNIAVCFTEERFQGDDKMVQFYTGFPTFETLMNVFTLIVPSNKNESRKSLSSFQQFIMVLMKLKLNLTAQDIGLRFGVGQSNAHKLIQDWLGLLHTQLAPHITWPDDDEDVSVFTEMLRKTYSFLRTCVMPRRKESVKKPENAIYDIATLVCAGLYNVGEVSYSEQSDSEFDSFDDEW